MNNITTPPFRNQCIINISAALKQAYLRQNSDMNVHHPNLTKDVLKILIVSIQRRTSEQYINGNGLSDKTNDVLFKFII
jgi:hypothetical protein